MTEHIAPILILAGLVLLILVGINMCLLKSIRGLLTLNDLVWKHVCHLQDRVDALEGKVGDEQPELKV